MRRNAGLTVIELIIVVVLIAVVVVILFPVFARAPGGPRKATCISNVKQIALACIMYAQDYDEVLPTCVADDRDGTAHAVGGVYANWKVAAMQRDIKAKYGERYLDGRWMWQLPDLLMPYLKSPDLFNCDKLPRADPYFKIQTYTVGTDIQANTRDPRDPLIRLIPRAPGKPVPQKVQRSGSYAYMCMHHRFGRGVRASDYGADFMSVWDIGKLLGLVGDTANPQDYFACGNTVNAFDAPEYKPLAMCRSFGVHEGYGSDYTADHVPPAELGGKQPTIAAATPMAFADGHTKYVRLGFYDVLALLISPNKLK